MTHYVAGVGFVEPEWKQIEDLRKMLKEVVFQFEGLVRYVAEDEYMDDELEALFVALLSDARKALDGKPIKPKLGGTTISKLWREDVKALREIIDRYGGHHWDCDAHVDEHGFHFTGGPCTCGWTMTANALSGTGLDAEQQRKQ